MTDTQYRIKKLQQEIDCEEANVIRWKAWIKRTNAQIKSDKAELARLEALEKNT